MDDVSTPSAAAPPRRDQSLEDTLLWLCSIPSPIGEEGALCDLLAARFPTARRYGNSIVVPLSRVGGRPHVALVGHLDTVRTENGPARKEGGRIFGAGAADMKSGLAVMLAIADDAATLPCDLTLVFYAREEGPYLENELGPVLAADPDLKKVDLAVCLEPSDNKLHLGCCGTIHANVAFAGRTGHSARPWEGDNAIVKAAPLLARLAALQPIHHVIDGHDYRTVTTVTLANGGRGRNVVPDAFVLNLNHRFAPTTTLEEAQADIVALVGREGDPVVTFTDLSPAAMPSARHPLVQKLIAAGARGVAPKQAWTDVARFSALGIPAVNFGPGENAQAHQKNESTSTELLVEGLRIIVGWLRSLG